MSKSRATDNKRIVFDASQKTNSGGGANVDYYDGRRNVQNLGAGDSFYIPNFVRPARDRDALFAQLLEQVPFEQMFNFYNNEIEAIPRLIAAETDLQSDSSKPIYRMPGCNESNIPTKEWSEVTKKIVEMASEQIDQPLNHCVLTLYRDENDSLAFHQDKVLDLADKSLILSISLGAARPFLFHPMSKKPGLTKQTIVLQPGSLLAIGPNTNRLYKHAVPKLRDPVGPRISLSVRHIETFVNTETGEVLGKGAEHQQRNWPFIKSHDNASEYTEDTKAQIEKYRSEAKIKLRQVLEMAQQQCAESQ